MAISVQRYVEICQCNASKKYRSVAPDKQAVFFAVILFSLKRDIPKLYISTDMRRITTFRSTTDRIYDGCPIIL
jgi:hypothetical protein